MEKSSASIRGKVGRISAFQVGVSVAALTLLILALSSRPVAADSKGGQQLATATSGRPTQTAAATSKGEPGQSKRSLRSSNLAPAPTVWGHKLGDDSSPKQAGSKFGDSSALESNIANAQVQVSPNDMSVAAGHHHHSHGGGGGGGHGKYYMYAESPKKGAYKMGFRRGNHKHMIERKESAHKSHVHSYFKWHDKKGKGSHKFEFKHSDYKKKKHHY